jgi:hypothetical protein
MPTTSDALRLHTLCLVSILILALLSMANQHSSTAERKLTKKGGANFLKRIWDLIKRPKSGNAEANPSNLNPGSVSSASVHEPVPGKDGGGTAEPTAAREFIGSISINAASHQGMYALLALYCPGFLSRRSSRLNHSRSYFPVLVG